MEGVIRKLKLSLHSRLVDELDIKKADFDLARDAGEAAGGADSGGVEGARAARRRGSAYPVARDVRRKIVKDVLDEALGLGPLEDLLADRRSPKSWSTARPDLRRAQGQARR